MKNRRVFGYFCYTTNKYLATVSVVLYALCVVQGVECFATDCPFTCVCKGTGQVDCSGQNLTDVPLKHGVKFWNITQLDLGKNMICNLSVTSFSQLATLTELRLGENEITDIPDGVFSPLHNLIILKLTGNRITHLHNHSFAGLTRLSDLTLDSNSISTIPPDTFRDLYNLLHLRLDSNLLTSIPTNGLDTLTSLRTLGLNHNRITSLPDNAFASTPALLLLSLNNNIISNIGDHAFDGLNQLTILDLSNNQLKSFSPAFYTLTNLKDLYLKDNTIEYFPKGVFAPHSQIENIVISGNPISSVHQQAYRGLAHLTKIVLSEAADLTVYPDLTGCHSIHLIRIDRASIRNLPQNLCANTPLLQSFDVHSNYITDIPNMSLCGHLKILDIKYDVRVPRAARYRLHRGAIVRVPSSNAATPTNLGNNEIISLEGSPFRGLHNLNDLTLAYNKIKVIPKDAFNGMGGLKYLSLLHNKITHIHEDAFAVIPYLQDLNLGENAYPHLPTKGLSNLHRLKTFHNQALQELPSHDHFPDVQDLVLSYAYHCCEYLLKNTSEKVQEPQEQELIQEKVAWLQDEEYDMAEFENISKLWQNGNETAQPHYVDLIYEDPNTVPDYLPEAAIQDFRDYTDIDTIKIPRPPVTCRPQPGPFMPCHDLFGWWSLRCGVWIMFLLALLGNGVVLFVAVFTSRSKIDVTRFLICNLACADFIMGVYLGMLAVVDAYTLGEFKMHAIAWQLSAGCKMAGFLAVLSSEMSVFVLAVITLERYYAITHAMQLNKRLSLRHAAYIMLSGWTFSLMLAALPLVGVSDYRKFAVCLPFEISTTAALGYVCFLMTFNATSFTVIISCYAKMYWSIRGTQTWNSNDMRVAKRMALLVFTDFACWAPVTFLSLTAAFGVKLITLEDAKVFTIFVLPLNSCANPFLYAVFTKQFKRDCMRLCKRIEESAVSRRFTQFSNRQFSWSWITTRRASGSTDRHGSNGSGPGVSGNVAYYDVRVTQRHVTRNEPAKL